MAINNETFFEFDDELNEGFTTIPNYILNDPRVTFKAVGVYVQILQYRNTGKHKVYLKSLANYRIDKKTAVSTGIQELEKHGYITRIQLRNEKGHMNGMKYIVRTKPIVESVENTTCKPKTENLISDNPVSDFTPLKIKSFKKENGFNKKNNVDVVVNEKENQLLELYKAFKIEKRIMPHTQKLLKENLHIALEVFEEIFISASEDSVLKKYAYIKTIIDNLNKANIKTLEEFNTFNSKFKESKNTTNSKGSYATKKNRFHNFNQTFTKYSAEELEKVCKESQELKFSSVRNDNEPFDFNKDSYNRAIEYNWEGVSPITIDAAIKYAKANNLPYKEI